MTKMRVACVGAGSIAERHLGALVALGDVELAGLTSRRPERAASLARKFTVPLFDDLPSMLDKAKPEALFVCVTPGSHGDIERAAIERKIPFFVEKPLAIDWDLAASLAAEVERAKLVTGVGYHFRYLSTAQRAKDLLAGKHVGLALGYWLTTTPPPAWWSERASSGGQTIEQMTHIFDLARYLVSEVESVYGLSARVARTTPDGKTALVGDVDEVSAATVKFTSGGIGSFSSTHVLKASYRVGLHLFAENLALELSAASLIVDDGRTRTEYRAEGDATQREDRAFLDAVRSGDTSRIKSTYADALRTHRVTTRVVESAKTGAPIVLEPAK